MERGEWRGSRKTEGRNGEGREGGGKRQTQGWEKE